MEVSSFPLVSKPENEEEAEAVKISPQKGTMIQKYHLLIKYCFCK